MKWIRDYLVFCCRCCIPPYIRQKYERKHETVENVPSTSSSSSDAAVASTSVPPAPAPRDNTFASYVVRNHFELMILVYFVCFLFGWAEF